MADDEYILTVAIERRLIGNKKAEPALFHNIPVGSVGFFFSFFFFINKQKSCKASSRRRTRILFLVLVFCLAAHPINGGQF